MKTACLMLALLSALAIPLPAASVEPPITLPPHERTTLANGLRLVAVQQDELPVVTLRLLVMAGSAEDPAGREGLARLTGMLLNQGTASRTAAQIADAVDGTGGVLNVEVSEDGTAIEFRALSRDLPIALDLLSDVATRASFPGEEVARQRDLLLAEIASALDDPDAMGTEYFNAFLFGTAPYGHPVRGWHAPVTSLTRDDVAGFFAAHYVPGNAVLAVVGDVEPAALRADVERSFGTWSGAAAPPRLAPPGGSVGERVLVVDKPDVTQAQIRIGNLGLARSDPDYVPAVVLNTALGGTFYSRLMNAVRVERGLTYSIRSGFTPARQPASFLIDTFTRNEKLTETIAVILEEVEAVRREGLAPQELEETKEFLVGTYPMRLETSSQLASRLLDAELFQIPVEQILDFRALVRAVRGEDIRRVAKERLDPATFKIVVLARAKEATASLAPYGAVRVIRLGDRL
jgi:zinc protease